MLCTTKEQEHLLKDYLISIKNWSLSVEEYQRKFMEVCDNLAAISVPISNINKAFSFARGFGPEYKNIEVAMLTKPPYLMFSQFLLALQSHNELENEAKESKQSFDHNQAFF